MTEFSKPARLFGLFADLAQRDVLVIGGGGVATRKVNALLEAKARITVCAPMITSELKRLVDAGEIQHTVQPFESAWLDEYWLTVAASNNAELNKSVSEAAHERKRFVNVVDDAQSSSVQVPSIVNRGALQIAISTAGAAPAIGRKIRAQIEAQLDSSVGALIEVLGQFRQKIKARFPDFVQRRRFYEQLPHSRLSALLRQGDRTSALGWLEERLSTQGSSQGSGKEKLSSNAKGHVSLVGAGPGAQSLLTLGGLRALQSADVILHDHLASSEVLALARRDAKFICVGKRAGQHSFSQDQINALLVTQAQKGLHVVRLKGGDPFIFGRGGEELEHLRACGVSYDVVPGITAALACAAYAGVPLTHRSLAQSVQFITAHDRNDKTARLQNLSSNQTLVFYMGVGRLEELRRELLSGGLTGETPFAIIENGTRAEQRVISGRLQELPELARSENVKTPALLIVGEVCALAKELAWFGEDKGGRGFSGLNGLNLESLQAAA